ncbi:MAG: patatin-like phospholipase family protein [Chloroflexi bacterium]|nr:patatin-like phospholipase family protein [Chloroflexota bacterium]
MTQYAFKNLVFQGGGIKSFAYHGLIPGLEEAGILPQIERVGGTSSGAMIAAVLSFRLNATDSLAIFRSLDYSKIPGLKTAVRMPSPALSTPTWAATWPKMSMPSTACCATMAGTTPNTPIIGWKTPSPISLATKKPRLPTFRPTAAAICTLWRPIYHSTVWKFFPPRLRRTRPFPMPSSSRNLSRSSSPPRSMMGARWARVIFTATASFSPTIPSICLMGRNTQPTTRSTTTGSTGKP